MSYILIIVMTGWNPSGGVALNHIGFQSHALCEQAAGDMQAAEEVHNANSIAKYDLILLCEPDGGSDATN